MTAIGTPRSDQLFLGLDSSTQSLKAIAIDGTLRVTAEYTVSFDEDLPEYETKGGVHIAPDGLRVTSPPLMWVAALDLLLARMQADNFAFADVAALSGSGQQHGSVYLNRTARSRLQALDPEQPLRDQLGDCFALDASPIWMDSSTTAQCRALEAALGGAQRVADLTGSRAYERFTGNQIAKIYQDNPAAYEASDRIALVSSFMASLLLGGYAPIDTADGSGMNLMDIRRKDWVPAALDQTAPDLAARLGAVSPAHAVAGPIAGYFAKRYAFDPACRLVTFSGDNPNSLAGLLLRRAGDIAVSLGTSDTMFGALRAPSPSPDEGHIFVNPVDPEGYMAMVVHKNGSLTREQALGRHKIGSWPAFEKLLAQTPPGNNGNIGFYFTDPEITPPTHAGGTFRFDRADAQAADFPAETDVRALIESQFLSLRLHGEHIGLEPGMLLATGGASENMAILSVLANVFGVPVYRGDQKNSAALGAAYRALHGWVCEQSAAFVPFADALGNAPAFSLAAEPDTQAHAAYNKMLDRYARLEKQAVELANRDA